MRVEDDIHGGLAAREEHTELRRQPLRKTHRAGGARDVLLLMRVMHEDAIARCEPRDAGTDRDHLADAGVAELDREAVAARERRQIEREIRRHLPAEHEHLGPVRQARGDAADADLSGAGRADRLGADLDFTRARKPDTAGHHAFCGGSSHFGSP